jgi:hypothetical protein
VRQEVAGMHATWDPRIYSERARVELSRDKPSVAEHRDVAHVIHVQCARDRSL